MDNANVADEKAKASENTKAKAQWKNVDAQICSLMWWYIDSKLMPLFRPFHTLYEVWEKACFVQAFSH